MTETDPIIWIHLMLPFILTPSMVFDGMGWKCHEKGLLQK
jgi:hypothetical protein